MAIYEIPLRPQPQTFPIALAGTSYRFTLKWNDSALGGWVLDIADEDDAPILSGLPLVTGADLLAPHKHLNFGGALWVVSDSEPDAVPTWDNLGQQSHLLFVTP